MVAFVAACSADGCLPAESAQRSHRGVGTLPRPAPWGTALASLASGALAPLPLAPGTRARPAAPISSFAAATAALATPGGPRFYPGDPGRYDDVGGGAGGGAGVAHALRFLGAGGDGAAGCQPVP